MTIQLSPDVAQWVQEQIATGRYESENEVLRAAMKALCRHRAEVRAISEGIEDMDAPPKRAQADADREKRPPHKQPPAP
jgi:putative addiction module CopG family antidote